MALPAPKTFKQELPPAGGFKKPAEFPVTGYAKRGPARGPASWIIVAGALGATAYGWYRLIEDRKDRNYYNLSKWNERFERAYVSQARENVSWQRRQKQMLDWEREVMKYNKDWIVNKPRYLTQKEEAPLVDVLDNRKVGIW